MDFLPLLKGNMLFPVILGGIILLLVFIRRRKGKKKRVAAKDEGQSELTPNALVMDCKTRNYGLEHITLIENQDYGRQWNYDGQPVCWLKRCMDNVLEVVEVPETLKESPSSLYRDLHNDVEVKEIFGSSGEQKKTVQAWLLIVFGIVALVLMYLYSVKTGEG